MWEMVRKKEYNSMPVYMCRAVCSMSHGKKKHLFLPHPCSACIFVCTCGDWAGPNNKAICKSLRALITWLGKYMCKLSEMKMKWTRSDLWPYKIAMVLHSCLLQVHLWNFTVLLRYSFSFWSCYKKRLKRLLHPFIVYLLSKWLYFRSTCKRDLNGDLL